MKVFVYQAPRPEKRKIAVADIKTVDDLMGSLLDQAAIINLGSLLQGDVRCILPGGEDNNEAFKNAELLKRIADENHPIQLMKLPTDHEHKIANIMKYVFDYLRDEHGRGNALTIQEVNASVETLVKSIQDNLNKNPDPSVAEFLLNLGLANQRLMLNECPSIISEDVLKNYITTPKVIKLEASKFIRDRYPQGYVFSDIEEIVDIANKFGSVFKLGVPKDTLEGIFLEVCPMK